MENKKIFLTNKYGHHPFESVREFDACANIKDPCLAQCAALDYQVHTPAVKGPASPVSLRQC